MLPVLHKITHNQNLSISITRQRHLFLPLCSDPGVFQAFEAICKILKATSLRGAWSSFCISMSILSSRVRVVTTNSLSRCQYVRRLQLKRKLLKKKCIFTPFSCKSLFCNNCLIMKTNEHSFDDSSKDIKFYKIYFIFTKAPTYQNCSILWTFGLNLLCPKH